MATNEGQSLKRQPRMSKEQISVLVEFMANHSEFARDGDLGPCGHSKKNEMWQTVANTVSCHGSIKTIKQCTDCWNGLKKRAQEKNTALNRRYGATGNLAIPDGLQLSVIDQQILSILGTATRMNGGLVCTSKKRKAAEAEAEAANDAESEVEAEAGVAAGVEKKKLSTLQRGSASAFAAMGTLADVAINQLAEMNNTDSLMQQYLPMIAQKFDVLEKLANAIQEQSQLVRLLIEKNEQPCTRSKGRNSCRNWEGVDALDTGCAVSLPSPSHHSSVPQQQTSTSNDETVQSPSSTIDEYTARAVNSLIEGTNDEDGGFEDIEEYIQSTEGLDFI